MIRASDRFPYMPANSSTPAPWLPLRLAHQGMELDAIGLLDTGSSLNVLPHSAGVRLGLLWEQQTVSLQLTGNLAVLEARAVVVVATVGSFSQKRLAFAWTKEDRSQLILGQVKFFAEFDVFFFRSRLCFDVSPRGDVGV